MSYGNGSDPIGVQVSENPELQQDMAFDDYQLQQFTIFEEKYGRTDTEIRKHPEWHGTFMNYFLHAEGKGEDLKPFYEVADWLRKHPLPSDEKTGKLGSNDTIFSNLLEVYRTGHSLPDKLPMDKSGAVDEFMLKFLLIRDKLTYQGHPLLASGRLCMNDVGIFEDDYLYAEGNRKAFDVFRSLGSMSSHKHERTTSPDDISGRIAENVWSNMSIKLTFDDMNIRGVQILDALEYAGGSVQKLYECVNRPFPQDTRDPDLCKYCNMRAAKRIRDGISQSEYVAVAGGASFDKQDRNNSYIMGYRNPDLIPYGYKMTSLNYAEYLEEVKPIKIDWSNVDIIQDTSIEDALKAAEARGFKVLRKTGFREKWNVPSYAIMMYNPQTGAFIHMPAAQENNVCFGGCEMDFWAKTGSISWQMLPHASSGCPNHYNEVRWNRVTYNEGLFSSYDEIIDMLHADAIDWNRLGFVGYDVMPVPRYYDTPYIRESDLSIDVGFPLAHMMCDMGGYRMQCVINTLIAHYDEDIDFEVCPQYRLIKDDKVAFTAAVYHFSTWSCEDVSESLKLCRLIKLYLQMPDEEYHKLIAALRDQLKERDQRELERINNSENTPYLIQKLKNEFYSLDAYCRKHMRLAHGFKHDELLVEKFVSANGRSIDTFGVKLPWM